jgi:hypothetical protein
MTRVYIPSAGKFGTVTGSRSCGFLSAVTYLHVRCDSGEEVSVLAGDTVPAQCAVIQLDTNVARFPTRRSIPISTPDGSGPSAA